jgi:outer membrane protein insertion porin family
MEKRILIFLLALTGMFSLLDAQRIAKININGNSYISKDELLKVVNSEKGAPYSDKVAALDSRLIHNLYLNAGFLFNRVEMDTLTVNNKFILAFGVYEGARIEVGEIKVHVSGDLDFDAKGLVDEFIGDKNWPYTQSLVSRLVDYLSLNLSNLGHPFSKISGSHRLDENNRAMISLNINPGPLVRIEGIKFVGLVKVRENVVNRETTFKKGDIFSMQEINKTQNNLYNTGLFDYVGIRTMVADTSDSQSVVVSFLLREIKPAYLELAFGFAYEENVPYNLSLAPEVTIGHNNLWGTGRRAALTIGTEYSFRSSISKIENTENLVRFRFVEPKIFHSRFDITTNLQFQQKKGVDRIDYNLGLIQFLTHYKLEERYIDAGITLQKVNTLESGNLDSLILMDTGNRDFIASIWNIITIDTRKHFINPVNALVYSLNSKYAYSIPLQPDSLQGNTEVSQYLTFRTFWNNYMPVTSSNRLIYALRLSGGIIIPIGKSDYIPVTERLYLGGSNSIRGIREQTAGDVYFNIVNGSPVPIGVGGKLSILMNNELRWIVKEWESFSLGFEAFVDAGYVWTDFQNIDDQTINAGSGLGVLLITPIGALRFDYAANLNPREWNNIVSQNEIYSYEEPPFLFHFGINFAF